MSTYKNKPGVWIVYDYDTTAYALSVHIDVVDAAKLSSRLGYGHVGFWPFGMTLPDAINWWKDEDEAKPLMVEQDLDSDPKELSDGDYFGLRSLLVASLMQDAELSDVDAAVIASHQMNKIAPFVAKLI